MRCGGLVGEQAAKAVGKEGIGGGFQQVLVPAALEIIEQAAVDLVGQFAGIGRQGNLGGYGAQQADALGQINDATAIDDELFVQAEDVGRVFGTELEVFGPGGESQHEDGLTAHAGQRKRRRQGGAIAEAGKCALA